VVDLRQQIVSLHTLQGVQLYQFLGSDLTSLSWSRENSEVSRCELAVPSTLDYDRLPDIIPWLHWISVWDASGEILHWTGPIHKTTADRETLTISARDMSSLFTRTRCPLQKRWDIEWPVRIASELLDAMIERHSLPVSPVVQPVRPEQYDQRYSFAAPGDEVMLEKVLDDLSRLGLRWTVVSGTPVLGPLPRESVASLTETDFVGGGITVVRDGSATFNDVLLRGADSLARAQVPMGGLSLQTIVNIDDMFGVSNADRAVRQYAAYTAKIRDSVTLPDTAVLHPDAPLELYQLVPSARVTIDAYGLLLQMELSGIDVAMTSESMTVSLRMASVETGLPELAVIQNRASISEGTV
jgi:hypothetical protein